MNEKKKVVTRIAPSPTGNFHIGTARVALFNFIYAKQHGGEFVLRIEDTDFGRCTPEFEQNILDGMQWLGLTYDRFAKQSERTELYTKKLAELIENDKAYVSKEVAKDGSLREVEVVRLRNSGKDITFTDEVHGDITFNTTELGDFVIARSVTDPLYHLAVVIDDEDMGVTHVIRGDDHISNTPRQILIAEAFGYERPTYAHLPLILATDRSKLSKRKGAVAVSDYKALGFLPEAVINYLALLSWNSGTEKELYTLEELIRDFSLSQVQKAGAVFDIEKFKWLQKEHKKKLPKEIVQAELLQTLSSYPALCEVFTRSEKASTDIMERFPLISDLLCAVEAGEYDFYMHTPVVTKEGLVWAKDPKPEGVKGRLDTLYTLLETVTEDAFLYDEIKSAVLDFAETEGKGGVLWPMRYALSGKDRSPDPFLLAEAVGKQETLLRIKNASTVCV
jgi:glutamyl-tRNA synthetase